MTETKHFLNIEALNDGDGLFGTGPDYYKNDYCRFTFIGTDVFEGKRVTIPNCKYYDYIEETGAYQFINSLGDGYVNIRRKPSGEIELTRHGFIMTVDDILLTEENDTRHIIRHRQMTAGKKRRRKRRTKKRTKKRRYL